MHCYLIILEVVILELLLNEIDIFEIDHFLKIFFVQKSNIEDIILKKLNGL